MRKISPKSLKLANAFGGLGYLSVIFQWLWTATILLPSILSNQSVKNFITPTPATQHSVTLPRFDGDSFIFMIIAIIFTVFILILTALILVRLPFKLVEISKNTVDTAVQSAVPIITHHKQISPKQQRKISFQLKIAMKLIGIFLPVILLLSVQFIPAPLDIRIIFLIGISSAVISFVWFILQYGVAKMTGASYTRLI